MKRILMLSIGILNILYAYAAESVSMMRSKAMEYLEEQDIKYEIKENVIKCNDDGGEFVIVLDETEGLGLFSVVSRKDFSYSEVKFPLTEANLLDVVNTVQTKLPVVGLTLSTCIAGDWAALEESGDLDYYSIVNCTFQVASVAFVNDAELMTKLLPIYVAAVKEANVYLDYMKK